MLNYVFGICLEELFDGEFLLDMPSCSSFIPRSHLASPSIVGPCSFSYVSDVRVEIV